MSYELSNQDKRMVRQIVGRRHVGESNLSVIRYFRSRLKRGAWGRAPREVRRAFLRCVVDTHKRNLQEYIAVMR